MTKSKKILFVATVDMFTKTGGGLVTRAFYEAYKRIFGDRIVLMHAEEYFPNIKMDNVVLTPNKLFINKGFKFITGHVHRFYPDIVNYLESKPNEYCECVINGGVYAGDSIKSLKRMGIRVTVIHHNFERQYHLDNKTMASFYGHSAIWINYWEKRSYLLADKNLFLTQYDLNQFKKYYGECPGLCYLIGSFMPDDEEIQKSTKSSCLESNNISLVTSGALNFPQSNRSIIDFYNQIFKKLPHKDKFKFLITGRNPTCEMVNLNNDRSITVIPSPNNIYEIIKKGDIYVCPLKCGGGIKMRIMDGLKCGKPIIAHVNSARGYEVFLNKPYFELYNSKEDFIKSLNLIIKRMLNKEFSDDDIKTDYIDYFSLTSGISRLKMLYS